MLWDKNDASKFTKYINCLHQIYTVIHVFFLESVIDLKFTQTTERRGLTQRRSVAVKAERWLVPRTAISGYRCWQRPMQAAKVLSGWTAGEKAKSFSVPTQRTNQAFHVDFYRGRSTSRLLPMILTRAPLCFVARLPTRYSSVIARLQALWCAE